MFHGLTAHYLAYDLGKLGPGVTCLVHAASGGIGQLLVQLGDMDDLVHYIANWTDLPVVDRTALSRDRKEMVARVPLQLPFPRIAYSQYPG